MVRKEPSLLFVNDGGYLRYNTTAVLVHDIIREIISLAMVSAGKSERIAFLYPNYSYDAILPYCLEMLYQSNCELKLKRKSVLIIAGKEFNYLKESYKNVFYGTSNYCNNLFGLGTINNRGNIKREKCKGIKKTNFNDKLLFSSRFSLLPNKEIAENLLSVVVLVPTYSSLNKIINVCQWCEENGIPSLIIFDPYPTAGKIKFYGEHGFISYGWNSDEIYDIIKKTSNVSTPISNVKALYSNPKDVEYVICRSETSKLFYEIGSILNDIQTRTRVYPYEYNIINEAESILRRLSSLAVPLANYDKEYFNSFLNKPLSESIDNFIDVIQSNNLEVTPEIKKLSFYFIEIKKALIESNQKFNEIVIQIRKLLSEKKPATVFVQNQREVNALVKSLESLKIPITLNELNNQGISIRSFNINAQELLTLNHEIVVFSTYPPHDKKYLLSLALKPTIIMYPYEKDKYDFYVSLYNNIEEALFTKERRSEIMLFLDGQKQLEDIKIQKVHKENGAANIEFDIKIKDKPKNILEALSNFERNMNNPSAFEDVHSGLLLKKDSLGELKISCIEIKFNNNYYIYLREGKTVQILNGSDDIEFKMAQDLRVGETFVLINRDLRMSLNDLILEKAYQHPRMRFLYAMIGLWTDALREGMKKEEDNEEKLLTKINGLGANIKHKSTLKNWIEGEVIGPRDSNNIARIAEIYNNTELKKNAKSVVIAISQLRGLRRKILQRSKNALVEGEIGEIEKLGLDLSEFDDAIEFFNIISIKKVDDIPVSELGKVGGTYEL